MDLAADFVRQNPDLHVILSSGYTDHKSRWADIQQMGFRYLEKPYILNELIKIIQEAIGSSSA